MIKTQGSLPSEEWVLWYTPERFSKLKLGMRQFRAIKLQNINKKDFAMDLVGKREIHRVHEGKIISLTASDNGNFVSARLVRIIAYFS